MKWATVPFRFGGTSRNVEEVTVDSVCPFWLATEGRRPMIIEVSSPKDR